MVHREKASLTLVGQLGEHVQPNFKHRLTKWPGPDNGGRSGKNYSPSGFRSATPRSIQLHRTDRTFTNYRLLSEPSYEAYSSSSTSFKYCSWLYTWNRICQD